MSGKLESDNTSKAHDWAKLRGWWTCKLESPTFNGVPDRVYVRRGVVRFVEWKKPGGDGVLSAQQKKRIKELTDHRIEVRVFDNMEDFKEWMR